MGSTHISLSIYCNIDSLHNQLSKQSPQQILQNSDNSFTDQVRPALGSVGWSVGRVSQLVVTILKKPQKTSKLPYYRPFRPDTQILSALTALY